MNRRSFITALGAAAAFGANAQVLKILGRKPNASSAPNIILMMADDMGVGDVGYYGWNDNGNTVLTPNLDTMAATGLRFDRFYAQSPVCSPTRGSCISGRHAFRYGIWEANVGQLRGEEITLPEILKTHAGYTCGHFGKWHLGALNENPIYSSNGMGFSPPSLHGFDEWFSVHSAVKTYDPYGTDGLPGGTDDGYTGDDDDNNPYFTPNPDTNNLNGVEYTQPLRGDTSEIIMDRAIPFMESAVNQGKPFLSCIWFHTPHKDLDASPEDQALYPNGSDGEKKYYGSITAMDRQIGRLRAWLRDKGIEDNTLLWFTCDNGQTTGSSGPYLGAKRHLFEGGIRVPTVLEWPKKIPAHRTTDVLGSTSDYFLTHLDVAGIDYADPHLRDGFSLLPVIEGTLTSRPGAIGFQSHGMSVLMTQQYKAAYVRPGAYSDGLTEGLGYPLDEWLLFDMTLPDPYQIERTNIAAANAALVAGMAAEYESWNDSCRDSYYGADYDIPDYDPGKDYREDAGL